MLPSPETRPLLLVRLGSARDEAAWAEFLAVYEPLICGSCAKGLQESDARDVCQQTLAAVAGDIEQWKPDGGAASFRRWLFTIARNRTIKFLVSERRGAGPRRDGRPGKARIAARCHVSLSAQFDRELRQQLLLHAASQIRDEFRASTWQAFWRTCVDGRTAAEAAAELKMSTGNVYVARSRIIARLRERVSELEGEA